MNRTGDKYPNKYTDTPHSVLGNEAEELKKKPESTCSAESQNKQTSHVQFEDRNPKTEVPPRTQQSAIKKTKQQRYYFFSFIHSAHHRTMNTHFNHDNAFVSDQQRQQYKQTLQHERHQQILKQLTIHRPTKSVNQKQPAAERTDVLYDSVSAKIDNLLYLTKWATLIMTCFFSGSISSTINQPTTSRY